MTIKGVLLDAGNTLIRVRGSVGAVYAATAADYGVSADVETLDAAFRARFADRRGGFIGAVSRPHSPERERAWWMVLVREVFTGAGLWESLSPRFSAFFDDLYGRFEAPEVWEVFPDVFPSLDALAARGVPLGVVSNWDSRLHSVLKGLGFAGRFRFVLTSAEHGAEKPDPSIFEEAAGRLGLSPGEVLHAGDLWRDDVEGAASAGMQPVWLDRRCSGRWESSVAWRVRDLREVVGLMDQRSGGE